MANFVQRFLDDFTNSTVDMQTDLGNGSISEPAGTTLNIDCPIGVNCEWYTSPNLNSPVAYEEIADHIEGPPTTIRVETRMTGVVRSGTQIFPGIVIWQDRSNAYRMGWIANSNIIHLSQTIAGSGAGLVSSVGGIADPSVTPHVYRIYWNGSSESAVIEEGRILNPGEVSFYWSDDDGVTFNHLDTRTLPFTALRVGIYSYNFGSLPSCDADFDYFSIGQDDQKAVSLVEPESATGVSDEAELLDQVGPQRHTFPDVSAGQLVPGPIDQELGSVGPFDVSAADDYEAFPTPGGPIRHTYPDVGAGQLVPGPPNQDTASVGPFDAAGVTDEGLLSDAGGSTEQGVLFPGPPDQIPDVEVGPGDAAGTADDSAIYLSIPPDFRTDTADSYAHAHFIDKRPFFAVYHQTSGIWTTPTDPTFNGFGRDGYEYISGVQQPSMAPWATEGSSADRSPRSDFPRKVLIAVTPSELVIYDLDNYPTDLSVWMRFLYQPAFSLIGSVDRQIADVAFVNGTLVVGTRFGSSLGRLHLIDFKATGQDFFHLIGSDDHWLGLAGRDITNRNDVTFQGTTALGGRPELRIQNEYCYSIDGYAEGNTIWAAVGGEDGLDVIEVLSSVPQFDYAAQGPDLGAADIGDSRKVAFDFVGWMWWSVEDRLFRTLYDYQSGVINADSTSLIQKSVQFPDDITSLVSLGNFVYAGTESGVYQIDRGTMAAHLAYTTSGGGGRGREDAAGTGEKVAGDNPAVGDLSGFSEKNSDYVEVATGVPATGIGAVTIIRNFDNVVVRSRKFTAAADGYTATTPELLEGGAFFNRSFRTEVP